MDPAVNVRSIQGLKISILDADLTNVLLGRGSVWRGLAYPAYHFRGLRTWEESVGPTNAPSSK